MQNTLEVFWRFFLLGWVSFGGPMAHIGYFRNTFVEKLNWIDDAYYSRLVALSQFLPGPGSSQVGFAIGLHRAGVLGGWAAFVGFTLPSFLILFFIAFYQPPTDEGIYASIVHGLKLLAVVVVADAVLGMFNNFCKDKFTVTLAVFTAVVLWLTPGILAQVLVLITAAIIGRFWYQTPVAKKVEEEPNQGVGKLSLVVFLVLFVIAMLHGIGIDFAEGMLAMFNNFFQAGSLVFGGGHVVLPLLQELLSDQVSHDEFLTGYAMAQAVPGPMFTFASYLGAILSPDSPFIGAVVATLGVFLPGLLLVLALQSVWAGIAQKPEVASSVATVNAAVVGLLIAALYQPVFVSSVKAPLDMGLVLIGFVLLRVYKLPVLWLVTGFIATGAFLL